MASFATMPDGLRYTADCFNRALAQRCGSDLISAEGKQGRASASVKLWMPFAVET